MRRLLLLLLCAAPPAAADDGLKARAEAQCAELTQTIEGLLGPKFRAPVPVRLVDKKFIVEFARSLEEKMTPAGMADAAQRLAVRLHQIPPGYDLTTKMLEMLEQGVAGLYDPDEDCFYIVESAGTPGTGMFTVTAAHELIHAYRDVDKDYWPRVVASAFTDEDWAIAVSCLVEGDAQMLGMAIGMAAINDQPVDGFLAFQVQNARQSARQMRRGIAMQLQEFPYAVREMFATRYAIGQVFAADVYTDGGKEALAAAYDRPPRSTEQVLHPEKYLADEPDEPTVFSGGDPTAALGEGWSLTFANVLGEFALRVHFAESLGEEDAEKAAAGWDGARYFFCEKEGEPAFVGMVTTWDTEEDAAEFRHAWLSWARRRDRRETFVEGNSRVETAEGLVVVRLQGRDAYVADGVPADRAEAVLAAMAKAERAERKADATPVKPPK